MHHRGAWKRRAFAVAAIALTLAVIAPELAAAAGAGPARAELAAKRRYPPRTEAQRKARILAAMRAKGLTRANTVKRINAALAARRAGTKQQAKPQPNAATRRRQRALAARRRAAARNAAKNKKSSSLSLPFLAFLALLPFVLMGLYLLGADYWRRREPRGTKRGGGSSLVITRVSNR
jgi:hypothetical protein